MSRGGRGLEDFSFYSEIFLEATSEASNIFCLILCNKKKIFQNCLLIFSFPNFDIINPDLFDTTYWCELQIAFSYTVTLLDLNNT